MKKQFIFDKTIYSQLVGYYCLNLIFVLTCPQNIHAQIIDTLLINPHTAEPTNNKADGQIWYRQGACSAPDMLMMWINNKKQKFVGTVSNP
ncbi:hypothetical protein JW935_16465 [candidate division KSB1 bacterium]|nr:hypothetical protein [candidate division KSB1 bacterium]